MSGAKNRNMNIESIGYGEGGYGADVYEARRVFSPQRVMSCLRTANENRTLGGYGQGGYGQGGYGGV